MGKVVFVGAGPGDSSLITVKGLAFLQQADCIIYDRLIDPVLLSYAKAACECMYVGKKASAHTLKQLEINKVLVEKANQYDVVVRLKGGDGYVFGRGGEEALYVKEHGIPFEVVPGISSSIGGLAYAGIPITHRGIASGFHVVTAHNKKDELAAIDWQAMQQDDQTYVFLMGLSKLNEICENLLQFGKAKQTPVAVIANATLPNQQVVVSDLQHIAQEVKQHPLPSPAMIVVGDVVTLRKELNFFEEKTLFQAHIILPKVGQQPTSLSMDLRALGAYVQELQVSELISYPQAMSKVCLSDYTYLIFTSKNAVKYFMEWMADEEIDVRSLSHLKIVVIGKATQVYLKQYHIYADLLPKLANSEALYDCLASHLQADDKILFPKVQEENPILKKLQKRWVVKEVILYENQKCKIIAFDKEELNKFDMIVFNCSSAVRHVMELWKDIHVFDNMNIISIGETTSHTLQSYGIMKFHQADTATYEAVKNKIIELWEDKRCIEEED